MGNFKIAVIGTGNVAWHLAPALENAGHTITEIYSRDPHRAQKIINQLYTAEAKTDLDFSESEAEIYILAVSDHAISLIADEIILPENSILVHTSGSMPLETLSYSSASFTGILYPLQSFSKSRALDMEDVPFLLESDDQTTLQKLKKLAKSISPNYYVVKSKDRKALHVAAVFASNFTNHMIRISEDIMRRQGLDFEMLQPLIIEQISKTLEIGAKSAQTGPASRGDLNVLDLHHQFLNYNEQLAEIYKLVSQDIIDAN
ncbi:F420-dependent NADP oxidoreductase [Echinicola sediminis]